MAFDRLQALGDDKFRVIINRLVTGTPAMTLAKEIQSQWGEFKDIPEKTLTQQLNRLRQDAAEGVFGKAVAKKILSGQTTTLKVLEGVSRSAITRMEQVADMLEARTVRLLAQESLMTTIGPLLGVNGVFEQYRDTLKDIQKMRFDLGLDEFKGVVVGVRSQGASITTRQPDGSMTHKQVYEAMMVAEQVFTKHGIPNEP